MIRVFVVATAVAVRAGLRAVLGSREDITVIGEAKTLEDIAWPLTNIDILILAGESSLPFELSQLSKGVRVPAVLLLVSGETPAAQVLPGLPVRAWGILPLEASAEEILAAVGALHNGLVAGAPTLLEPLLLRRGEGDELENERMLEPLTEREREVLQLLAQGLANKQIAVLLGISEHTVKFHISSVYSKLGSANRAEAIRIGIRKGLIAL